MAGFMLQILSQAQKNTWKKVLKPVGGTVGLNQAGFLWSLVGFCD